MKKHMKNKIYEAFDTKTSSETVQSSENSSQGISRRCKITHICCYMILGLAFTATILIVTVQVAKYGRHCKKKANEALPVLTFPTESSLKSVHKHTESDRLTKNKLGHIGLDKSTELSGDLYDFEFQSNPFNLSREEAAKQWRTAKVPSLRRRVKRFACWHSCFGQFRKKAFRTLYGSSLPLFPSSPLPKVTEENKEKKRETRIETATAESEKGTENNELGEGEEKGTSEVVKAHDTTSKLNATPDFFKLKTKVVEEKLDETNVDATSPVNIFPVTDGATVSPASKESEGKDVNENRTNTKPRSKGKPSEKKSPRTAAAEVDEESESREEGETNTEEDAEESESPEGADDDGEVSGSNESVEDKGDGIDKKDLEEEEKR